jgi:alpha-N-arabinofuranosidase
MKISGADVKPAGGTILTAPAMNTMNTFDAPQNIKPSEYKGLESSGDTVRVHLPAKSVVVLELK